MVQKGVRRRKSVTITVPVPSLPSVPKVSGPKLARGSRKLLRSMDYQSAKGRHAVTSAARRSGKLLRRLDIHSTEGRLVVAILLVAATITSLAVCYFSFYVPDRSPGSGPVQRMRLVTVVVPGNISNEDYFIDPGRYGDMEVSVKGMLQSRSFVSPGSGIMSVYSYYLVDDFGRKMNLTGLSAQQQALFPQNNRTEAVYEIRGIIRVKFEGFYLQVIEITPSQRPQFEVTRQVPVWEMSATRLFFR